MIGSVSLNKLNLMQGNINTVENHLLFIGEGVGKNEDNLVTVGVDTDLDQVLGSADSPLKTQVSTARAQAGQKWTASVMPLSAERTWGNAVDFAMELVSVEGFVLVKPVTVSTEIEAMQAKTEEVMAKYMRPLVAYGCTEGLKDDETWDEYVNRLRPITANVAADQVSLAATLWGPELGAYTGRICSQKVTVADSPMRVATGPLIGEWSVRPTDSDGRLLDMSLIKALNAARYSCPQWYADYPGMYFTDGEVLDVPGGDFQCIENVRVIHKCMRKVYPLLVAKIADRRLNEEPGSIAYHESYLMRPLREMSKSRSILGVTFPGEIHPPKEGDIKLYWISKTKIEIYMVARPYNSPKEIECNLMLDLENYA